MKESPITFLASFPPIQTAISTGIDGMRIKLDIPESEMAEAVHLLTMRDCVLEVTIKRATRLERRGRSPLNPKKSL